MSNVDAAWYRMDHPENAADVVALLGFNRVPSFEVVRRVVEERLLPLDRFRQRVVPAGLGFAWDDDPGFDLDRHLRRHRLRSRTQRALEDLASEIATEPLDPARPLWRVHYISRPGGAGTVATKLAHCMADGFVHIGLLLSMGDRQEPVPLARHPLPASRLLAPWLDPAAAAREALSHPSRLLSLGLSTTGLAIAVARIAALRAAPPTALSRPLAGRRRTAWSRGAPLGPVRAAARQVGAGVNDLLLAAVAGALRTHLAASGAPEPPTDLRALVPVNLRPGLPDLREGIPGNRFGLVFLDLPTRAPTARERLELVRARRAELQARPDAVATWMLLAGVGALPRVEEPALRFFAAKASLVVTSVPGPRRHLSMGGARLDEACFFVPHPSTLGLGVSILSYGGEVRMGVRADEAVLAEPSALVARLEAELTELGALGRHHRARHPAGAPAPSPPTASEPG